MFLAYSAQDVSALQLQLANHAEKDETHSILCTAASAYPWLRETALMNV